MNPEPWYTPWMETDQQSTTFIAALMSPPEPALPALVQEAEVEVFAYPPLTQEEDDFCLGVIEFGGNIGKAYRAAFGDESTFPIAKGKKLLGLPQIALKIKSITDALDEGALISTSAHLDELARIRDLASATGELKVAYQAERSRGEAVGIYQKHDAKNRGGGGGNQVQINVVMASPHDRDI